MIDTDFVDPIASAQESELTDRLRQALTEINTTYSAAFSLVYLEGLSNLDTARALEVTVSHLGVMLHRARQALKEKLMAFDPETEKRGAS
jgi:RNA polymerase sigma-70 factor (ECF subfamily)